MQPTPFPDTPSKREMPPSLEEAHPVERAEPMEASCAPCEADDGSLCPVHGSLVLELL